MVPVDPEAVEGPSIHLAAAQLKPFIGQRIRAVRGNTTLAKGRLLDETVREVFAWGKHLVLQCGDFALRVHFLMFGSYEADVEGVSVSGEYKRTRSPRLALTFRNGELRMYACSVRFIEGRRVRRAYDLSLDVLSRAWDPANALKRLKEHEAEEIADVLLDQEVFAGVGNIIKNEVLSLEGVHPATLVRDLSHSKRRALVARARSFSRQFLAWRKAFVLKKNLRIHRQRNCPECGGPVTHMKTGERERMSHFCPLCQRAPRRSVRRSSPIRHG